MSKLSELSAAYSSAISEISEHALRLKHENIRLKDENEKLKNEIQKIRRMSTMKRIFDFVVG